MFLFAETSGAHFTGTELIAALTIVIGSLTGAVVFIFKLLMAAKDKQLEDAIQTATVYKTMLGDATRVLQVAVNAKLVAEGKSPLEPLAKVVPEHQSPVTQQQQDEADRATARAIITAATLALNEPARTADVQSEKIVDTNEAIVLAAAKNKQEAAKREQVAATAATAESKDSAAISAIKEAIDDKAKP